MSESSRSDPQSADRPSGSGAAASSVRRPEVVMYAKTTCPYCHSAERLLRERGVVQIDKILIDQEPGRRPEMIEKSGGRTTVPQIFIDGRHVGGCDDLYDLDRGGELAGLLA